MTGCPHKVGRIVVTTGSRTSEYFFTDQGLQCCLSYQGREPTWLERNKLGVEPVPIRHIQRHFPNAQDPRWQTCTRNFERLTQQAQNLTNWRAAPQPTT